MDEREGASLAVRGNACGVICLAAAGLTIWAILDHRFALNGTVYYRWLWREAPGGWRYGLLAALSVPFFAGQWLARKYPHRTSTALALMMATTMGLMWALAIVQERPASLAGVLRIIEDPMHFGYFRQAKRLLELGTPPRKLLAEFPTICGSFTTHPRIKPPGLLLIDSLVISVFGELFRALPGRVADLSAI
jgi:hypothetical protein